MCWSLRATQDFFFLALYIKHKLELWYDLNLHTGYISPLSTWPPPLKLYYLTTCNLNSTQFYLSSLAGFTSNFSSIHLNVCFLNHTPLVKVWCNLLHSVVWATDWKFKIETLKVSGCYTIVCQPLNLNYKLVKSNLITMTAIVLFLVDSTNTVKNSVISLLAIQFL